MNTQNPTQTAQKITHHNPSGNLIQRGCNGTMLSRGINTSAFEVECNLQRICGTGNNNPSQTIWEGSH